MKNRHRRLAQALVTGLCFQPPGRILQLLTWDAQHSSHSLPLPAAQFRCYSQQPKRTPQLAHLGRKTLLLAPLVARLRPGLACGCLQRRLEVGPPEVFLCQSLAAPLATALIALLQTSIAGRRRQALAPIAARGESRG